MELSLIKITNKHTKAVTYRALNDRHYDAYLATGGCWEFEKDYEWVYLSDVEISEEILNEQGWFLKDETS